MNFHLDIATGILALIIGQLISGVLGFAYSIHNKNDSVMRIFMLSRLIDLTAWIFIGLRGVIDTAFSIFLGNTFLIVGAALQAQAILTIKARFTRRIRHFYIVFLAVCIPAVHVLSLLYPYENLRIAAVSIVIIVMWLYPTLILLAEKQSSLLQKLIAFIYAIGFIPHLYNVLRGLIMDTDTHFMSGGMQNMPFFLTLYITMLAGNLGIILMWKERGDANIAYAAAHDELTGILNRRTFLANAEHTITLMFKKKLPLSFMIMDLDHFKSINDTYGHFIGDLVLRDFADTVRSALRPQDISGRFGGEEFTVLLPDTAGHDALRIAENIRSAVDAACVNGSVRYTVSIGLVNATPDEHTTIDTLYKSGDYALYQAKENGRNRVEVASDLPCFPSPTAVS